MESKQDREFSNGAVGGGGGRSGGGVRAQGWAGDGGQTGQWRCDGHESGVEVEGSEQRRGDAGVLSGESVCAGDGQEDFELRRSEEWGKEVEHEAGQPGGFAG